MDKERFGRRMVELLPKLIRGFARQESNYLSRGKITLPQLWALEYLSRKGEGTPMSELARFLGTSRPAATGLTDRLIGQSLVRREHDRKDRRVVHVAITAKGRGIISHIWEQKRKTITRVFGQIPSSDRAQYLATLERVVHILGERETKKRS